jgi:hypothetical protein
VDFTHQGRDYRRRKRLRAHGSVVNAIFHELIRLAARRVPANVFCQSSCIDDHDVGISLRDRELRADVLIVLDQFRWRQPTLIDICNQNDGECRITDPRADQ